MLEALTNTGLQPTAAGAIIKPPRLKPHVDPRRPPVVDGSYNHTRMANRITRERMIEVIRELPADATIDDAIERLVFLAKIEEGLAQLDRGEGVPHDEVKRRLGL